MMSRKFHIFLKNNLLSQKKDYHTYTSLFITKKKLWGRIVFRKKLEDAHEKSV